MTVPAIPVMASVVTASIVMTASADLVSQVMAGWSGLWEGVGGRTGKRIRYFGCNIGSKEWPGLHVDGKTWLCRQSLRPAQEWSVHMLQYLSIR